MICILPQLNNNDEQTKTRQDKPVVKQLMDQQSFISQSLRLLGDTATCGVWGQGRWSLLGEKLPWGASVEEGGGSSPLPFVFLGILPSIGNFQRKTHCETHSSPCFTLNTDPVLGETTVSSRFLVTGAVRLSLGTKSGQTSWTNRRM